MNELITLDKLEQSKNAIAEIKTLDEIKQVSDQIRALRAYAEARKLNADIRADIDIMDALAARQMGVLTAAMQKASGGDRRSENQKSGHRTFETKAETLEKAGLSKQRVNEAEKLAEAFPDEGEFRAMLESKKADGKRPTKNAVLAEVLAEHKRSAVDTAPEPQAAAPTPMKPGERVTIGKQTIICGDMREKYGIAPDIIFTDPPYGMRLDADFSGEKTTAKFAADKSAYGGNRYERIKGDHDDFDPAFIERLLKVKSRELFLWGANYYAELLPNRNEGSWFVWDKRLDETMDRMYGSAFELCWSREKHKQDIARVKWAGIFGTEKEFDHRRWHPTQKPVALAMWFLQRFSKPGDKVLDPFCGAGFTLLACEQLGLEGIGIEIEPRYAGIAAARLRAFINGRV